MHQQPFTWFKLCIVKQHMLNGGIRHADAGGSTPIDTRWNHRRQTCRMVGEFLREAIHVESAYTGDILAKIVASTQAGATGTADQRSVRHHAIAWHDV